MGEDILDSAAVDENGNHAGNGNTCEVSQGVTESIQRQGKVHILMANGQRGCNII